MAYTESNFLADDGLNLFLRTWTPDSPPRGVLIIIHGLGEHAGRYQHLVNACLRDGYVIFGHDHRGYGRSQGKRGDFESFNHIQTDIDTVVEHARAAYPDLPILLYAHSLGGMYATHYLADNQDKISAAVLSSPGYGTGPDYSRVQQVLTRVLYRITPNMTLQTGNHDDEFTLSHCPVTEQEYRDDEYYHHTVTIRFAYTNLQKAQEARSLLNKITIPILVVMGEEDTTINRQAIIDAATGAGPNVSLRRYNGCLHEMHNESVDLRTPILAEIVSWQNEQVRANKLT